jgi:hypothetical protein
LLCVAAKTKGDLRPDESEIDIPTQQRAGITALVDRYLPRPSLEIDANLRNTRLQRTGHLMDFSLLISFDR